MSVIPSLHPPPNGVRSTREVCCNLLWLWKALRLTEVRFLTEDNTAGILESWQEEASLKVTGRRKGPQYLSVSVTGGEKDS